MSEIILITHSYPGAASKEAPFLNPELAVLGAAPADFKIRLMPQAESRDLVAGFEALPNVEVDFSLARELKKRHLAMMADNLISARYWRGLLSEKPVSFRQFRTYSYWVAAGQIVERVLGASLKTNTHMIYSYWFDFAVGAALKLKLRQPLLVGSRVHGYDLYDERAFHPFRADDLRDIDFVLCVSEAARTYLSSIYGHAEKQHIFRLGTGAGHRIARRVDKEINIVSCSFISAVKRVDLMYRGIREFACAHPERRVNWTHYGGGKHATDLAELTMKLTAPNLAVSLKGDRKNCEILNDYRSTNFHIFLNTSSSEGAPMSIMEALSHSLPVAATDVGGNSELVNDKSGTLLPPDPTSAEIADGIERIVFSADYPAMALSAHDLWREKFDASRNHQGLREFLAGRLARFRQP